MNDAFQIIGDGKELAIIMPGQGTVKIINPTVCRMDIDMGIQDCSYIGENGEFRNACFSGQKTINLEITPSEIEYCTDSNLIQYDIFTNKTILELFEIINKKIKQRK